MNLFVYGMMTCVCAGFLAGCAVGPDFHPPAATLMAADIPGEWWGLFKSPELDRLIRGALADNPTLEAAQAALRQAREDLNARAGGEYVPEVNGSLSASRQKTSSAAMGLPQGPASIFTLYHASVNVSYVFDVFGRGRRELEALRSLVDYQAYQHEAARLALTANIVTTVIMEASLREQVQATLQIMAIQQKHLIMLRKQQDLGGVSRAEFLSQRTEFEQTRALLPPLRRELSQLRYHLTVLAGKMPVEARRFPKFHLAMLHLPLGLPSGLPASLTRQRPDLQAAEALLHAASARVGVATADLYPRITLNGSYGRSSAGSGNLFDANNAVWDLGAGLVQPLVNGGALRAKRRGAVAAMDEASSRFRQTLLMAFEDVSNALRALEEDGMAYQARVAAQSAARDSLTLAREQFVSGAASYILLLNAERQYQQACIALIQARSTRLADAVALFQSLGGGWWNRTKEK